MCQKRSKENPFSEFYNCDYTSIIILCEKLVITLFHVVILKSYFGWKAPLITVSLTLNFHRFCRFIHLNHLVFSDEFLAYNKFILLRNLLVAIIRSDKEKSRSQNTHCRCDRNRVKIFHTNFGHHIFIGFQSNLQYRNTSCEKE